MTTGAREKCTYGVVCTVGACRGTKHSTDHRSFVSHAEAFTLYRGTVVMQWFWARRAPWGELKPPVPSPPAYENTLSLHSASRNKDKAMHSRVL